MPVHHQVEHDDRHDEDDAGHRDQRRTRHLDVIQQHHQQVFGAGREAVRQHVAQAREVKADAYPELRQPRRHHGVELLQQDRQLFADLRDLALEHRDQQQHQHHADHRQQQDHQRHPDRARHPAPLQPVHTRVQDIGKDEREQERRQHRRQRDDCGEQRGGHCDPEQDAFGLLVQQRGVHQ
ncbi:hypothetical protein FQZ97_817160 [compost metagenome]